MTIRLTLLILTTGLVLAACSESNHTNGESRGKEASSNHVWKTQTDALEKAQSVEETLQTHARELDQQIQQ